MLTLQAWCFSGGRNARASVSLSGQTQLQGRPGDALCGGALAGPDRDGGPFTQKGAVSQLHARLLAGVASSPVPGPPAHAMATPVCTRHACCLFPVLAVTFSAALPDGLEQINRHALHQGSFGVNPHSASACCLLQQQHVPRLVSGRVYRAALDLAAAHSCHVPLSRCTAQEAQLVAA